MESEIPKVVYYQAFNFFGVIVLLYFLTRGKIRVFFAQRHDKVTLALNQAKEIMAEAERRHQEYTIKLQNLERESSALLTQAKHDAELTKEKIIEHARSLAKTIEQEAKHAAENEIKKARAELYDEVLSQALDGARAILQKSVVEKDQKRLQKEFVEKIEAVQ